MTTGRYLYRISVVPARFRFLTLEFLSQNTQTLIRTCACVLETYVRSDITICYRICEPCRAFFFKSSYCYHRDEYALSYKMRNIFSDESKV